MIHHMRLGFSTLGARVFAVSVVCLTGACRQSVAGAPVGPADPQLTVTGGPFTIERKQSSVSVDIPYRFVNRTSAPLASLGCSRSLAPPQLEWWTGRAWQGTYGRIVALCLTLPPPSIAPGSTISNTLHVRIAADSIAPDGHRALVFWYGPHHAAEYRLRFDLCAYHSTSEPDKYTCPRIAEDALVSRSFRMGFAGG